MNRKLRGYLSIFAAAFFWGASGTAAKFLFQHDISPLLVVESRVVIASIILLIFFMFWNRGMLRVKVRDIWDFILLGIIGVAGSNYSYYVAIQETTVGIAILMQYTAPVLVAVYMVVTKQEKISRIKIIAILLSLIGCIVMLGAFDSDVHITRLGIFLGALSAVCFAFFNIYTKAANKQYSIWTALTYTLMSASLFWGVLNLFVHPGLGITGPGELVTLSIFSFSSALIPYFFYFTGLRFLLPSTAVIVSTLEPVIAILTAFVVLGETLYALQVMGGVFVIFAVILLEVYKE